MSGALLIGGTSSDAGKSLLVAGLCRVLHRRGLSVAPFKAQNMSNNSVVTADGGEIGRAQGMQAFACGLAPSTRFNPVLLKPGSDRRSQVVVRGVADGWITATDYHSRRAALADIVASELASLRGDFDVVVCEGAGSIAEINLRATDIANMGLAAAADIPVVVVGDIDRGGVLAHLLGSVAALPPEDQSRVAGFLINKFRGAQSILDPGLRQLHHLCGRPTLGVIPWADDMWLDAEDSLSSPIGRAIGPSTPALGSQRITVAAIRLPRLSNSTDLEALACEPGVDVRWVDDMASVAAADLAVLPGTRATVSDLAWLRARGLDAALIDRAAHGRPIVAVCGGYQMLARRIDDTVESGGGVVDGLGLLDIDIVFDETKLVREVRGHRDGAGEDAITGYEIHHGRLSRPAPHPHWIVDDENGPEGCVVGAVWGTHWHGLLANGAVRRAVLAEVADRVGKTGFVVAPDTDVDAARMAQIDLIADLFTAHVDLAAIDALLADGVPRSLPTVTLGLAPTTYSASPERHVGSR
ncbi:cobalamin biosynthesis protein CobQ [Williamsia sp. Leaf354]|uniref:cobyric acid synthase n=1 Tax=Williamsia sp. Leaf354 TaxID=1736349 RepID=UPI0006FEA54B|nr:cobyric acid synthase [Williamsia sp. Leaf354]KQR98834.1 cobalamin biosynthesis protein CobQ [Williamsia sp. Leaf354]